MTILSHAKQGKPLSEISTFGIGGPARYFLEIDEIERMRETIRFCHETRVPYIIIGKGSNSLFDDRGFDGLVILNKISFSHYEGPMVNVGAGYSFSLLGVQTARKGFAGLEFASGIPASVGGAVFMNAGANGSEVSDCLTEVGYISEEGELLALKKEQLAFSYRLSSFQHMKGAIVSAKFLLTPSGEARQKQFKIIDYRMKTQPYKDQSIGCIFRNPAGSSAGALIQECGLKGAKIGGAQVSDRHANFIINAQGATAQDVLSLAEMVKKAVHEKKGIDLELEIRCIPYQL